jgi:hypothetical protein
MRLVFVHGINQEGKSEDLIKTEWLDALGVGLGGPAATRALDVRAPFYGDALAQSSGRRFSGVVAQGASADADETMFLAAALSEQARAAGAGARAIAAEERALSEETGASVAAQMSFPMDRRLNAILRVIEKLSTLHGDVCMSLETSLRLSQAAGGRQCRGRDSAACARRRAGSSGWHSLGTVVTFKLLRQLALEGRPIRVPLYVTLGSPLPLMAVQAASGRPLSSLRASVAG